MKTLEELKQNIISRAENAFSDAVVFESLKEALEVMETKSDLLKAITDHIFWKNSSAKFNDGALLKIIKDYFTHDELDKAGIYTGGEIPIFVRKPCIACGDAMVSAHENARVLAYGKAAVMACDNVKVEAHDDVIVMAYESAKVAASDRAKVVWANDRATVEVYNSATVNVHDNAIVTAYDNATVYATDRATVTAYDNATVTAYHRARVEVFGNARVMAYDDSYVEDHTGNVRPQSDHAIVRNRKNNWIYVKKGKFGIEEVD